MSPELRTRLQNLTSLPTPPAVAAQVINLAQQPDISLTEVAEAITCDPSLTAKIMRVASSSMYAQRRQSSNLRQALVVLGINATVTLALGFSLLPMLRRSPSQNQKFAYTWQRSVLSAVSARALASQMNSMNAEEAFLAALLQDIGIMAIDRLEPEFYDACDDVYREHDKLARHEAGQLGADHAAVGAWLLESWQLPEYLQHAVASSHALPDSPSDDERETLTRCVAVSGLVADLWLHQGDEEAGFGEVADVAERALGLPRDRFAAVMGDIGNSIPDVASMFETDLMSEEEAQMIIERAQEALTLRNLKSIQEAAELGKKAKELKELAHDLQEETQRDALTRVANRGYLEQLLNKGFAHAKRFGWPFSIAFIDLDHFKKINDTYGHQAGDEVLRKVAVLLSNQVRASDNVGRYGGEEFLLLLPGADRHGARVVGERVLSAMRQVWHDVGGGVTIPVTASIGCASLTKETKYATVAEFVKAADDAVYAAKEQGRDRVVQHEDEPSSELAKLA